MKLLPALLLIFFLTACRREEPVVVLVDAPVLESVVPRPLPLANTPPLRDPVLGGIDLRGAALGYCVFDEHGAVVLESNAHTAFIPASALKTITTATALAVLGPQFSFTTEVRSAAPARDGVIEGDLLLVGGGDPTLSDAELAALAVKLRQAGVRTLRGSVRGDGRLFGSGIYNDHWNWGDIGNGYGSGVCGLNVNHNRWSAAFQPGIRAGDPARLLSRLSGATLMNEVITGAAGSGDQVIIYGGERTGTVFLRGRVPQQREVFEVTGALPDPVGSAVRIFTEGLQQAGIAVLGEKTDAAPLRHVLLKHDSAPLLDTVRHIHEVSDNQESECLFRMLGVKGGREPMAVVQAHWKARGLPLTALRMADGCGLARADFVTPHDLARVQFLAGQGSTGADYRASLLHTDGLRWKGGAMSGVRTWTGYMQAKSGREYAFALLVNHFDDVQVAEEVKARLLRAVRGR